MPDASVSASRQDTMAGCAVRFFWMLIGNIALFFLTISIAQKEPYTLTWRDAAFFAVVLALIAARFVDIWYLDGKTSNDEPATRGDWRRYTFRLLAACAGVWLLAHALAAFGWFR